VHQDSKMEMGSPIVAPSSEPANTSRAEPACAPRRSARFLARANVAELKTAVYAIGNAEEPASCAEAAVYAAGNAEDFSPYEEAARHEH
jgi:hypothetical protein